MKKINEIPQVGDQTGNKLDLLLSKRPRESWGGSSNTLTHLAKPRSVLLSESSGEIRLKMIVDFKLKIQPEMFTRHQNEVKIVFDCFLMAILMTFLERTAWKARSVFEF